MDTETPLQTKKTVYTNARILDPATGMDLTGDVATEHGRITAIGPDLFAASGPPADAELVDCTGLCLGPGLVDMRVTIGEPGNEHKETIETASAAAAAGGITSMACLPNTDPVIDDVAGLEFIARRAREARAVKIYAIAAATKGAKGEALAEIGLLSKAGAVGFSDGVRAIENPVVMGRALSWSKLFDRAIIQHPEEPRMAAGGDMNAGEIATRLGLKGIPKMAEIIMIERDLRLAEMTGGRLHIAHVTTREGIDAIRKARARGVNVTCDAGPAWFSMTEVDVADYLTFTRISPPLRDEMDRRAVVEGLADGTIDAIASDHVPQDQDSKRLPFGQAENGMAGLETLFSLSLALVREGNMGLLDLLGRLTWRPADILGLAAGRLKVGAMADLILFDPDAPWKMEAEKLITKSRNVPWKARVMTGRILRTVVDGRAVFLAGDQAE